MNPSFTPLTTLQAFQLAEFQLAKQALDQLRNLYSLRWAAFWNQQVTGNVNTPQGLRQASGQVSAEESALTPAQKLAAWGTSAVANLTLFSQLGTLITEIENQFGPTLYPTPGSDIPTYPPGFNVVQNNDGSATLQQLSGTIWTNVVAEPLT